MDIEINNIVDLWQREKTVCITTNGFIKNNNGAPIAVIGRGSAKAMANIIPELPEKLGWYLFEYGHTVGFIYNRVIAFPTKPEKGTWDNALESLKNCFSEQDIIPGFWCKSDPELIKKSITQLNQLISTYNLDKVYCPVPGFGEFTLEEILPLLTEASNKIIFFIHNDKE
ncbi:MAG TPA: hypothetical protein PK564_01295 [bacterium]|nr:hypothetical protein [Caldisericia bacterium]HQG78960.1 hypothetical protein [bacterium]